MRIAKVKTGVDNESRVYYVFVVLDRSHLFSTLTVEIAEKTVYDKSIDGGILHYQKIDELDKESWSEMNLSITEDEIGDVFINLIFELPPNKEYSNQELTNKVKNFIDHVCVKYLHSLN